MTIGTSIYGGISDIAAGVLAGAVIAGSMIDVSDPVIVGIGTTIVGGLAGAIKLLWDRNNKLSASTDLALSKCEEEHTVSRARMDMLIQQVIQLTSEVGTMRGRIQGFQEATDKSEKREAAREAASHHEH